MDKAWLTYDLNNKPIGVVWGNPIGLAIEISPELAIDFIHGHRKLESWIVVDTDGKLELIELNKGSKIGKYTQFWNLRTHNDINLNIPIIVNDNSVDIYPSAFHSIPVLFFATVKHDPTWLIKQWNLNEHRVEDDKITVKIEDATQYSYYVWR